MMPDLSIDGVAPDDAEDCVVGYVRTESADPATLGPLCEGIRAFCRSKGLRLGPLFIDRGVKGDEVDRTGFTGLRDVLGFPFVKGVVMPSLDHLSPTMDVRVQLTRYFMAASVPILTFPPEVGSRPDGACV